jgi:hypothetical protein
MYIAENNNHPWTPALIRIHRIRQMFRRLKTLFDESCTQKEKSPKLEAQQNEQQAHDIKTQDFYLFYVCTEFKRILQKKAFSTKLAIVAFFDALAS